MPSPESSSPKLCEAVVDEGVRKSDVANLVLDICLDGRVAVAGGLCGAVNIGVSVVADVGVGVVVVGVPVGAPLDVGGLVIVLFPSEEGR